MWLQSFVFNLAGVAFFSVFVSILMTIYNFRRTDPVNIFTLIFCCCKHMHGIHNKIEGDEVLMAQRVGYAPNECH